MTDLADELISCQLMELPNDDKKYRNVVSEVQRHHHTKSCRKYNGECRYGFPKLPSRRTILAQPLPITINASDTEAQKAEKERKRQDKLSKSMDLLRKAKNILLYDYH